MVSLSLRVGISIASSPPTLRTRRSRCRRADGCPFGHGVAAPMELISTRCAGYQARQSLAITDREIVQGDSSIRLPWSALPQPQPITHLP